jgi:carbon starvation protein
MALATGLFGILLGGFEIQQPAFRTWQAPGASGALFPFLFVTIACGACSGFHGLVCSGTTSKQLARESHAKAVGYGGMLVEGFVALISLATIMIVASGEPAAPPGVIYGNGLARFLTALIGEQHFALAATFGAMAFSTFVFDTLDVSTRLGRYILQELTGLEGRAAAVTATAVTMLVPALVLIGAGEGAYRIFWTLFGTSNQLLAGLTLLSITVWLRRSGRPYWFTLAPMAFVMTVTLWSLVLQVASAARAISTGAAWLSPVAVNGLVGVVLILLAGALLIEAARSIAERGPAGGGPEPATT